MILEVVVLQVVLVEFSVLKEEFEIFIVVLGGDVIFIFVVVFVFVEFVVLDVFIFMFNFVIDGVIVVVEIFKKKKVYRGCCGGKKY